MFPEPRKAGAAANSWRATKTGQVLLAELAVFAEAHGWSPATRQTTGRAPALLAAVGGLRADPPVVPAGFAVELRRRHLPLTRLVEFLTSSTGAPISVEPRAEPATDDAPLADLPPAMRHEIELWLDVLAGNTTRARPHAQTTIAAYLRTVLPAVRSWSANHASLREVTTEEIAAWVEPTSGSARVGTLVGLRSLFTTLKAERAIFTNPARSVHPGRFPRRPVLGLEPATRSSLLARTDRLDHQLVMLLAGVHALTRADIAALRVDDVALHKRRLHAPGRAVALDELTCQHLRGWLEERRDRWPATANPHLLVTGKSAYGTGPVSTGYFRSLAIPVSRLRADRLLAAAEDSHGDPLAIRRMFGLDPDTAVRYCTELSAVEG